jgi:hypothetical protein
MKWRNCGVKSNLPSTTTQFALPFPSLPYHTIYSDPVRYFYSIGGKAREALRMADSDRILPTSCLNLTAGISNIREEEPVWCNDDFTFESKYGRCI